MLFLSLVFAEEGIKEFDRDNNRVFELFADNVDSIDYKIVIATGNAVMISQNIYVLADYIKYNTQTREAQINGNAKFYKDGNLYFSTQKANIKFDDNYSIVEPFYMQDSSSGVWISASMAKSKEKEYEFRDIVVSSCDIGDPIWRIEGTSGTYNQDNYVAGIWNPRIYIKDIPVFYFPYIFISTKNNRTTGFLYPEFTSSSLEGFVYIQPFFLALQDFWDMTFSPQIRTSRGYGLNTQLRFVDTYNELFEFNFGIFNNFKKYIRRNSVKNQTIYGFDFKHKRRNILSRFFKGYSDGIYLDFRFMNDLDYIRLQNAKNKDIENRIQTSKANFFGTKDDHYFGLYFKYFLDLQSPTNENTFHTIPQFQYHKFLEQTDIKNITYSVDVNTKSILRYKGFGYFDNSVRVPIYFSMPLLANYLTFGTSLNVNAGIITLNRTERLANLQGKNSTYFSTNYGFSLGSDIAKQYDKVFHSMSFKVDFSSKLYNYAEDKNHIFKPNEALIPEIRDSFGNNNIYSETQPSIQINFSQYFFGLENVELLYHRMYQNINLQDKENRFDSLRNEVGFSPISNISISNTFYYSYKNKSIEEVSLSISTTYGYFRGLLTYYLKRKFNNIDKKCSIYDNKTCVDTTANFLRVRLSHDFNYFALYGDIGYDFSKGYLRDWNLIISKDIRCFGIGLKFANEITPILTTSGTRAIVNRYVSLEFRFVPVTATALSYRFK
ncbi:LPS-assembly protein LptD [Helicobacter sp. MIT 14-3879]|uniref:LPS-assembly protein LptD n=1 Tax=Helicobacter sp. MIT 14-3879 TaxID=2040649 RepID=UPI0011C02401|nr:LPS-assembly protein LptD [Helicobacter sp. MIT 14-3879]